VPGLNRVFTPNAASATSRAAFSSGARTITTARWELASQLGSERSSGQRRQIAMAWFPVHEPVECSTRPTCAGPSVGRRSGQWLRLGIDSRQRPGTNPQPLIWSLAARPGPARLCCATSSRRTSMIVPVYWGDLCSSAGLSLFDLTQGRPSWPHRSFFSGFLRRVDTCDTSW
jgi:hypothetical protein